MTEATVVPQHMRALERANEVRLHNASLRREIGALPRIKGKHRLAEIIEGTEDERVLRARVNYLLCSPYRHGPRWAEKLLRRLMISPGKRLGDMTRRERDILAYALRTEPEKLTVTEWHGVAVVA